MQSRQIQQRNDYRSQTLNKEVTKMMDSIKSIIECSHISVDKKSDEVLVEKNMIEGLQLQLNVAQLISSTETLLGLVNELKEAYILGDYERHNKIITIQKQTLKEKAQNGENLLHSMKGDLNESLSELNSHLSQSPYLKM